MHTQSSRYGNPKITVYLDVEFSDKDPEVTVAESINCITFTCFWSILCLRETQRAHSLCKTKGVIQAWCAFHKTFVFTSCSQQIK